MSAPSPRATSKPPKLIHLALSALCRDWSSATALDGLSTDLAKLVWAHVKDHHARQGITPVPCAAMYPLVRAAWQVLSLDLSDAGKWITDTALQAGLRPTRTPTSNPPLAQPRQASPHQPHRSTTPAPPHQPHPSPTAPTPPHLRPHRTNASPHRASATTRAPRPAQALAYLPSLRSVRLTACKFVSNDGLAPLAALPNLETLDVSWSQAPTPKALSLSLSLSLTHVACQ